MGMRIETFRKGRKVLVFGNQKINLHEDGKEFEPKADTPTPGSANLYFILSIPLSEAITHLEELGVQIVEGLIQRTGITGPFSQFIFETPTQT